MNDEQRTCIICLDSPQQGKSLFLLQCGCRTAWFHESCESTWIKHLQPSDFPPKCPTCRRGIDFEFEYSFFYGINQRYFLWIFSLVICELFMCSVFSFDKLLHQAWYLPAQTAYILLLPFIIPSKNDLLYFLHQLRYRYLVFSAAWFIHVLKYKQLLSLYPDNTINLLIIFGFLHTLALTLHEVQNYCSHDHYRVEPFISFVTGYTLIHCDTLHFRQRSPVALKGDKLSSS